MHVVLVEPEIPPNTGNIARLCAATGATLHLIEPFGFRLDDATLKRAGMDYWRHVEWHRWPNWQAFLEAQNLVPPPPLSWRGEFHEPQAPSPKSEAPKTEEEMGVVELRPPRRRTPVLWFIESGGPRRYSEAAFGPEDYLVFGRETAGLPTALLEAHRNRWLRLPMFNPAARSLNLANCVAIVLYEALRQNGFLGEWPVQPS